MSNDDDMALFSEMMRWADQLDLLHSIVEPRLKNKPRYKTFCLHPGPDSSIDSLFARKFKAEVPDGMFFDGSQ